ncbi:MAG: hypothetical protein GY820_26025 [Gammaproteobacteria bacterium]|nr:hypothetical protein [Gammaproteobacteria bacterium]
MKRRGYISSSALRMFAVIILLLPGFGKASSPTAMDWVQTMSNAMRNLNYRGNFVYMHENQLESMSISHIRDETGEKERLLSLNGEAREVIRDNKNLTCIWPSSRKVVVDFSRKNSFSPLYIPDDIARVGKLYNMKLIGKDRVANYEAVVVEIKPKDRYRYGLKFWINAENGLLLQSNLINEHYRAVEQVMFTSLELVKKGDQLDLDKIPAINDDYTLVRYHSGENSGSAVTDTFSWRVSSIPAGFRQQSVLKRHDSKSGNTFYQMVYTDGLASLSVFIEKQANHLHHGKTSMGAVNAFIRVMDEYVVTAIGEVPAVTVQTLAESVFYQEPR